MRLDHLLSKEKTSQEVTKDSGQQREKNVKERALFNFEGAKEPSEKKNGRNLSPCKWGCSSAGRAPALHAGGQEFDPPHLHQRGLRGKRTAER